MIDPKLWIALGAGNGIILDVYLLLGVFLFFKLPKEMRASSTYWLPFFMLCFIVTYEIFGSYTNYNFEIKRAVNAYLGNTENPKFNLWLYNITRRQILVVLYLILIKSWLEPSKKKYINWMIIAFVISALVLQLTGIELMYLQQPIIFAIGSNMILVACGLYFIGLITNKKYLQANPLRLLSFWAVTITLFHYSIYYIYNQTMLYLYTLNPKFGRSLNDIMNVVESIGMVPLILLIAAPFLTKFFDREPLHESI